MSVALVSSALSPASQSVASPVPAGEEMNTPPRSRRRRRNKAKSMRRSGFGQGGGKQQQQQHQKGMGSPGGSEDDDDDSDDDDDDDAWQPGNDNSFARAAATRTPTSPGGRSRHRKKKLVPPVLLLEFKAFGECLSTEASFADSRQYAATVSLSSLAASYGMNAHAAEEQLYVCAAPLYEWHLLTEQTLQSFNVKWMSLHTEFATLGKVKEELSQSLGSPMPQSFGSPGTPAAGSLFGPSATFQPSRRKKMIDPKLPEVKRASLLNIVALDTDGKPTSAFAREDPMVALRKAIEIRKEIISANDRICADYNNQRERSKLETWNDQYLSSTTTPLSPAQKLSTLGTLSTAESSPLPRHAVNKQQLKLLESLLSSPTRSVEPRIRLAL